MKTGFLVVVLTGVLSLAVGLSAALAAEGVPADQPYVARVDKDGVQRVEMVGGSYYFTPSRIIVKVNVPVELAVRKEPGMVPHNIVAAAPEAGIVFSVTITDEVKTIRFTPTRAGNYPFYCDKKLLFLASHRDKGMHGVLEVRE
jgi:plastocyanin